MRSVAVVVALAACLHAGVWALLETRQVAPDVNKPLASVSYDSRPGGKDTRTIGSGGEQLAQAEGQLKQARGQHSSHRLRGGTLSKRLR
jgi:hypothetical protein